MRAAIVLLVFAGCAAGFGAPGPGAAGVVRVNGPGVYVDPTCVGWCKAVYRDGYIKRDGPGLKFMLGTKIGVTNGKLDTRERVIGIGSEPHVDLSFVPRSDRWAITASAGYVFQSFYYDDDTVAFRGITPSATFHWGLRRRFYVHGGVGHSYGSITVTPEGADSGMSAAAGQNRALAGATFVFRRTPSIDFALRVEANAYSGDMSGMGVTVEGLLSRF
jgi:hypothetical protein